MDKLKSVAPITPAQFIRQHILRMQTADVASAINVSAGIVSRYTTFPKHHRKTLDKLARERKTKILPEWYERVPFDSTVPIE